MAITGKVAFSFTDWVGQSGVALTAPETIASLPPENVQRYETALPYRMGSIGVTPNQRVLTIQLGRLRPIEVLAFCLAQRREDSLSVDFPLDLRTGDQVRWQLFTDEGGEIEVSDSGWVPHGAAAEYGIHATVLSAEITARRIDLSVRLAARPSGEDKVDFGRVWAGPVVRFEKHHASRSRVALTNNRFGHTVRRFSLPFQAIREDERDNLLRDMMTVRPDRQFFYLPRDTEPQEGAFVLRRADLELTRTAFGRNATTIELQEQWGAAGL